MALDFESLKNPEWIAKREEQWKVFEDFYGDDWTKKDRQHYKEYFFTGNLNKCQVPIIPKLAILFFPIQTLEGHQYAVNNFSNIKWDQIYLCALLNGLFLNCPVSPLNAEEKAKFFSLYAGKLYDPDRKFPFLLANESEYRSYPLDPEWLVLHFIRSLNNYIDHECEPTPISYLLDFMFSLFQTIESELLICITDMGDVKSSLIIKSKDHYKKISEIIRDLMCYASLKHINRKNHVNCQELLSEKLNMLSEIEHRFDAMAVPEYPAELIEHWQHIKSRNILIEISFSVSSDLMDNWEDFLYFWRTISSLEKDVSELALIALSEYVDDHLKRLVNLSRVEGTLYFHSYYQEETDNGKIFSPVFSCASLEIAKDLESFFKTLPVDNLTFNVTKIR